MGVEKMVTLNATWKKSFKKKFTIIFGLALMFFTLLSQACSLETKNENQQETEKAIQSEPIKHFNLTLPSDSELNAIGLKTDNELEAVVFGQRNRPNCGFETFERRYPYKPREKIQVDLDSTCGMSVYLAIVEKGATASFGKEVIDFDEHVMPIIEAACISCHNSKSTKTTDSLENYTDIFSRRYKIKNHMIKGTMPLPPQTMHPDDIAVIKQWVDGTEQPTEKPFAASNRVFLSDESFSTTITHIENLDLRLIE